MRLTDESYPYRHFGSADARAARLWRLNAAAYTRVDQAESEYALAQRINAEAPAVMASEAALLGAALVHCSTDFVFDGRKDGAYLEIDVSNRSVRMARTSWPARRQSRRRASGT